MFYIDKKLKIADENVSKVIRIDEDAIAVKLQNPSFVLHDSYDVEFQPKLSKFVKKFTNPGAFVFFPVIPQYFHNFYENFTKVLNLRSTGENFVVALIYPEDKNDDGVFHSLIRNDPKALTNAAHIKEFLDYINTPYICLTPEEFVKFNPEYAYAFYDTSNFDGPKYEYDKSYSLSHFLQVPFPEIILKDMDSMRAILPVFPQKENKIFISRKKAEDRKYKHEDLLEKQMIEAGYEIVFLEDMHIVDQIKVVQEASHVACLYGSALVNCGLTYSGTKVLSFNPTKDYVIELYDYIFDKYKIQHKIVDISGSDYDEKMISKAIKSIDK